MFHIDIACPQHSPGVVVVTQRQQQVLERGVFMLPLVGIAQGAMETLFKFAGEGGHVLSNLFHCALEWMLVLAGKIHHLYDFRFRYIIRIDAADTDSLLVNV